MTRRWLYVWLLPMLLSGCATVLPFERELLARGDMQFDSNGALIEAESHATSTREGSAGGYGAGGGGCGCN